mgnify:CR=1 FL=1
METIKEFKLVLDFLKNIIDDINKILHPEINNEKVDIGTSDIEIIDDYGYVEIEMDIVTEGTVCNEAIGLLKDYLKKYCKEDPKIELYGWDDGLHITLDLYVDPEELEKLQDTSNK